MSKQLDMFAPRPERRKDEVLCEHPQEDEGAESVVLRPQPPPKWATDEWFSQEDDPRDDRDLLPCGKPWPFPKQKPTRCAMCGVFDTKPKPLILWLGGLVHVDCHWEYMRKKKHQEAREQGKPFCVVCGEPYPEPTIPTFDGMVHVGCQEDYEHGGAGSSVEGRYEAGGSAGFARVPDEGMRCAVSGEEDDQAADGGEPGSVEVQGGGG